MKPLEASAGERRARERGKGGKPAQEGGIEDPRGSSQHTPMIPGNGSRPKYTREENPKPKPLEAMKEGNSMRGR